ncbi:MAG: hypothetical protein ACPGVD_02630 [Flavobacteriales bacterium]
MKWLSDRVSYHRHDEYTTILISSKVEKWKESLLFGWMTLWLLIGLTLIYFLVSGNYVQPDSTKEMMNQSRLFLIIFLVFWAYFAYRIIKVYLWRKKGVEYIKIDSDSFLIKRAFGKMGTAKSYNYNEMRELELINQPTRSFANVMGSSFWDISNETLNFEFQGKVVNFGIQLEAEEAKKVKKFIDSEIKKRGKTTNKVK